MLNAWALDFDMRETQIKALEWLEKNIDKKYFILQIPVGGGKSPIGITLAHYLNQKTNGDSYIITPQVILQRQYLRDFDLPNHGVSSIYGKSNYKCTNKKTTCDVGGQVGKKCDFCPYTDALKKAKFTPNLILNYSLAFTHFAYVKKYLGRKNLIIADECHVLERELTEFDSVSITKNDCEEYDVNWNPDLKTSEQVLDWMKNDFYEAISAYIEHLAEKKKNIVGSPNPDEVKMIKKLDAAQRQYSQLLEVTHAHDIAEDEEERNRRFNSRYILITDNKTRRFKARTAKKAFQRILEPYGNKFLFMSSTIINHEEFCKDLGINVEEAAFFDVASEFPLDNRPIIRVPTTKMNKSWNEPNRQHDRDAMEATIKRIIEFHNEESGIIHTANFAIAKWLVDILDGEIDHHIYHHNPNTKFKRDLQIQAFQKDPKPSILISPSSTEGLDLKGDLGRFAIFAKVPYPFLGDQWIKAKFDQSQEWYNRQAIINVIQGAGRVVRSKDDDGIVYILDDCFDYLYSKWNSKFPTWWRESVQRLNLKG